MSNAWRSIVAVAVSASLLAVSACSSTGSPATSVVVRDVPVLFIPNIESGEVGWCVSEPNGYSCPDGPTRTPIIAESWNRSYPPPVAEGYVVTTSQVVAVSIEGRRMPTRRESTLPYGLRGIMVEIRGLRGESESTFTKKARRVRIIPYNARGKRIAERPTNSVPFKLPTESVVDAEHPRNGACRIEVARPLAGLAVEEANTVVKVKPYKSLISGTLASCANTRYRLSGQRLVAAIMLDASHPGSQPENLRTMRLLAGHTDVFQTPGIEGEMVAKRIPGAWLFVGGRGELQQRLILLEHLRARVHLQ